MKKLIFVLMVMLMMLSAASAEDWCSIADIREQIPVRWTQTYETKWRTINIDAEINIPQVDKVPVVQIEGGAVEPPFAASEIGWDSFRFDGAYQLVLRRDYPSYPKKLNGVRLGTSYAQGNWYSGFAPENQYVPLDDITFGEIVDRVKSTIGMLGYDPDAFMIDEPVRLWAQHIGEYGKKNDVLPGYIIIDFLTKVEGIPVMSHVQETVRGDTSTSLGDSEFWEDVHSGVTYHGYLGDLSNIRLKPLKIVQTIADDIPLLSFDTIIAAIEDEINAGHIRKIYEIEFGYVLYNEPGRFLTSKPGKERRAEFHTARYYLRPMWLVNCLYKDTATDKLRSKPSDSDDERNTLDYYQLLIDAQTGEVVKRSNAQDRCEYKGFISWEDVE